MNHLPECIDILHGTSCRLGYWNVFTWSPWGITNGQAL